MRTLAILLVAGACAVDVSETEQPVTARKCPDGATIQGIDVSEYQGSIDWRAVKASGRVFGIARINVSGHRDPTFAANWRDMKAAGVIRGAYQYYKPNYDPVAEANIVVETLGKLAADDMPAMLDIEITGGVDVPTIVARMQRWLEIVEAGTGKRPLIYTGAYFWDDNIKSTAFTSYPLVIPWYGTTCPGVPNAWNTPGWKFHQYSETGTVPGVSSNPTDLDVFNGTEADLRAFIGGPARPCGTIPAEGGTIDDDNACFTAGGPSQFLRHVSNAGEGGGLIWTHATEEATESNFATWSLQLAAAGRYRVEVSTPAAFAQSKQAHYAIRAAGETTVVDLDQTAVDGWQSLGTFDFAEGGDQSVHLGDNTGELESANIQLVFDAVRLTPAPPGGGGGDPGGDDAPGDEPGGGNGGCTTTGGGGSLGLALALAALIRRRRA